MTKANFLLSLVILFLTVSCGSNSNDYEEEFIDENGYVDGTYCAEINYYNPNTGTRSSYNLNVEVESNEVTTIYWGNGGWLDEDHFYPEELDSDGYCSFTSDKGYEYEIQILGEECTSTDETSFQNDLENDNESVTCPKCGDVKDSYDEYCYNCQDEIEHTCRRCGQIDNFMFSTDDYCGDCEDELENTCSKCGGHEYNVNGGICDDCKENEEDY
ncbi:hypothetical protein [Wandonia haliotis]